MMKALEFLKQNRVYEDETIYNSVGEIVGTLSQLMEEYAALRQPLVVGRSEQLVCSCGSRLVKTTGGYHCGNAKCSV